VTGSAALYHSILENLHGEKMPMRVAVLLQEEEAMQ
jgi:hypothetical protein